ncbi:hypothetical protein BJV82DRAFT_666842 [Fennellomyces sp. T-0311]|nr:hypothetical protein BJV82DRAFT_666842 [Fennellomyces sp. T-0311]
MNADILPSVLYISLLSSLPNTIQSLNNAIEGREYLRTIQFASDVINQVRQSNLLLALLDVRSQAYSMNGQFELALSDGEQMIKAAPTSVAGYLRKGDLLSLYGRQKKAIATYCQGIQAVQLNPTKAEHLLLAKSKAEILIEKRVDFVAALPADITTKIIAQLPQSTKAVCLTISKMWRNRVIESANAWKRLVVNDNQEYIQLFRAIPTVGQNIQDLILDTSSEMSRSACINNLREGYFTSIRSLEMTARTTALGNFGAYAVVLSTAFWQIRSTLTNLQIDLGSVQNTFSMAELLLSCSNLTDLSFSTKLPMSALGGDFSLLNSHPLLNLEIRSTLITGKQIQDILRHCPNLRRLVMNGCIPPVLRPIQTYAQNLEILGYNHDHPIPGLPGASTDIRGLREIYTSDGGVGLHVEVILPLLYKNMETLETLYLCTRRISAGDLQELYSRYPNFKLKKVTTLTFWSFEGVQEFILRAIERAANLSYLSMVNIHDISDAIGTIICLPALKTLRLSHVTSIANKLSFLRLFETHAVRSKSQQSSLESITLWHCAEITDTVLASLARIKTLHQVVFANLNAVSTAGLSQFLHRVDQQLTYISLGDMWIVTDYHIATALAGKRNLTMLNLENLPNVTDKGIRDLIDNGNCPMQELAVNNCPLVTNDCIQYVKKKVKTVVYT